MHAIAKLTPLTRAKMVAHFTSYGGSLRATASACGVCEKTVRRWLARAKAQGFPQRLADRSSTPHQQPFKTSPSLESQILELRHQRRSSAQIQMVLKVSKATLSPRAPPPWTQPSRFPGAAQTSAHPR